MSQGNDSIIAEPVDLSASLNKAFRVDPLTTPDVDLDALNSMSNRTYSSAFEPVEDAIQRIKKTAKPSKKRIESWMNHPDERVVGAFFKSTDLSRWNKEGRHAISLALTRAFRVAGERGELWNPLFEVLAEGGFWGIRSYWRGAGNLASLPDYVEERILPWLSWNMDKASLADIMERAQADELIRQLVEAAPRVTLDEARTILGRDPYAAASLAKRSMLSPEMATLIFDSMVKQVQAVEEESRKKETLEDELTEDESENRINYEKRSKLKDTTSAMIEKGLLMQERHKEALLEVMRSSETKGRQEQEPQVRLAISILEEYVRGVGDKELAKKLIIEAGRKSESWHVRWLFRKEGWRNNELEITPDIGRVAVEHCSHLPVVLEAIAQIDVVRKDPEVREKLLRSKAVLIVKKLLDDEVTEEFPRLFRVLARKKPEEAADLLVEKMDMVKGVLTKKELAPILRAKDRKARVAAIQLISELDEPVQDKPETKRAGRQRV